MCWYLWGSQASWQYREDCLIDGVFNAELGTMRFMIEEQTLFCELIEELRIKTVPFASYTIAEIPYHSLNECTSSCFTWSLYYVTRTGALDTSAGQEVLFKMMLFEMILSIFCEACQPARIYSFRKKSLHNLRDLGKCMESIDIGSWPTEIIEKIAHSFTEEGHRWIRENAFVLRTKMKLNPKYFSARLTCHG